MRPRFLPTLAAAALVALGACQDDPTGPERPDPTAEELTASSQVHAFGSAAVYTLTNQTSGNELLRFRRAPNGRLSPAGTFATGGTGTGGGLGNQGALTLTRGGGWLLAVNPGSDDVSVFRARGEPRLTDRVSSGGTRPISVAAQHGLVYVLNGGGDENVTGFRLLRSGELEPIPGASYGLSQDQVASAQVSFSPDGRTLVVTEKATNRIVTFPVRRNGRLGSPRIDASAGQTPFGFAFNRRGRLVVSEAFGGAPGASVLSSYAITGRAGVRPVTPNVGTTQTAACWVVISNNGRFAYASNTASGTISLYRLRPSGALQLLDGVAAERDGSAPIDMALSRGGRFFYVLNSGDGTIGAYRVGSRGELEGIPRGTADGLPAGTTGLVAR